MKNVPLCRHLPLLGLTAFAAGSTSVLAQEAIEGADRVDQSRRARKQAIDRNLYNLKAGPVLMRLDAIMGFEINDNPHLEEDPERVDFAFHPQFDISSLWPINPYNALSFNLGIGYIKYIHNTDLDQLIIAPNSEISVDIRTGDVTINVHDRLSYTQDPVTDPSVSGSGDFGGLENTIGLQVDWDLNQLTLAFGYDHYNFISTGSDISKVQERSSELFYTRGTLKVSPAVETGFDVGGGLTDYRRDAFSDNTQFSIGPFAAVQLSRDLHLRGSVGFFRYDFDQNGTNDVPSAVDDFYADVTAEHQLSQYMSHRLSIGREGFAGAASELVTVYYARYQNSWNISQYNTVTSRLFYENGKERGGHTSEKLWRVGASFAVSVPITRQLTGSVGYQIIYKDSDQAERDYVQNLGTLEFRYAF